MTRTKPIEHPFLALFLALLAALLISIPAWSKDQHLATGQEYLSECSSLKDPKVLNSNTNEVNFCLAYISILAKTSFSTTVTDDQTLKDLAVFYINYLNKHPEMLEQNNSLIFPHIFNY